MNMDTEAYNRTVRQLNAVICTSLKESEGSMAEDYIRAASYVRSISKKRCESVKIDKDAFLMMKLVLFRSKLPMVIVHQILRDVWSLMMKALKTECILNPIKQSANITMFGSDCIETVEDGKRGFLETFEGWSTIDRLTLAVNLPALVVRCNVNSKILSGCFVYFEPGMYDDISQQMLQTHIVFAVHSLYWRMAEYAYDRNLNLYAFNGPHMKEIITRIAREAHLNVIKGKNQVNSQVEILKKAVIEYWFGLMVLDR